MIGNFVAAAMRRHFMSQNGVYLSLSHTCHWLSRMCPSPALVLDAVGAQQCRADADSDPLSVAVAAIRYLHLNPAIAQIQNITLCQHSASKFDIVQRCCSVLVWVPWPKDDILPVLLDEAADIVEGLAEVVPPKLPKRQAGHLKGYVNHVLRPCWKSNHPEWFEEMYRRQRPNLVENRDAVCAAVTALEFR